MHDPHRLEQIHRARQQVLAEGASSATDQLVDAWYDRAWLEQSWRRCLARGSRPDQAVDFELVPAGAVHRAHEAHRALLTAARPEMERLARAVAPIRYFAILTDAEGTVVETAGEIDRADRRAEAIARVGVDLSERSIGTSAIGAALGEQRPVWLHRGEHFFQATSVYSCAGAPLTGPTGQCIGMLDLTGIEAPERPELQHLVARSARAIENALALGVPHTLRLHLAWAQALPGEDADALLCLQDDGRIVSANAAARQMVPRLNDLRHGALHAEDLFALPWPNLADLAARDEPAQVPLWSGLRVALQAVRMSGGASGDARARPSLKALEAEMIRDAVREAGGHVGRAAAALGVSRATVYRRLAPPRRAG